ncbi:hypothetical protein ACIBAG_29060 [Streptomyces sp. NPDC051243]
MQHLPALSGAAVRADVLDGPVSIAFAQAKNRSYGATAVPEWCRSAR